MFDSFATIMEYVELAVREGISKPLDGFSEARGVVLKGALELLRNLEPQSDADSISKEVAHVVYAHDDLLRIRLSQSLSGPLYPSISLYLAPSLAPALAVCVDQMHLREFLHPIIWTRVLLESITWNVCHYCLQGV